MYAIPQLVSAPLNPSVDLLYIPKEEEQQMFSNQLHKHFKQIIYIYILLGYSI